ASVLARAAGPIEHVVEITQNVRRPVDEIEIRLAIEPAKGGVGQLEHVDVLDRGLGHDLTQGQLDRLSSPQMPGADRGGEDEDSWRHLYLSYSQFLLSLTRQWSATCTLSYHVPGYMDNNFKKRVRQKSKGPLADSLIAVNHYAGEVWD